MRSKKEESIYIIELQVKKKYMKYEINLKFDSLFLKNVCTF